MIDHWRASWRPNALPVIGLLPPSPDDGREQLYNAYSATASVHAIIPESDQRPYTLALSQWLGPSGRASDPCSSVQTVETGVLVTWTELFSIPADISENMMLAEKPELSRVVTSETITSVD